MISKKKSYKREHDARMILKEISEDKYNSDNIDALTAIIYLVEDHRYSVHRYNDKCKRSFIQRVNLIWFWPLFLLTIPIQWLIRGQPGISKKSRIGKIVHWLVYIG